MEAWLPRWFYRLQVQLFILVSSTAFFNRINHLPWYKTTMRLWFDDLGASEGMEILEVGCATGVLTEHIASSGHTPTGLDMSSKMVDFARKMHEEITFVVGSALDLPFAEEAFDGVIAASLLNIVPDKPQVVREFFRACKKGGTIAVLVPSADFDDESLLSLLSSSGVTGFSAASLEAWHNGAPKMRASEVSALFAQAGLKELTVKHYLRGMVLSVSATKPTS